MIKHLGYAIALLALTACGPVRVSAPGHSIKFTFDPKPTGTPRPVPSGILLITASQEDVAALSAIFDSFAVWVGEPENGVQESYQLGYEGELVLPWQIGITKPIKQWPPRVRVVGKNEGKWVVIREAAVR